MDQSRRHRCQFGHPLPDEDSGRVLLKALFQGVIDAQRVNARHARLHLALAVMDARLIIGKLAGKMQRRRPPVEPQMIGGKAHHHGAHAKGQPATSIQIAHAGIHQRIAGLPALPCRKPCRRIAAPFLQRMIGGMERAKLHRRFIFQFLNEMAVPVKTAFKTFDLRCPAMPATGALRLTFLPDLAH